MVASDELAIVPKFTVVTPIRLVSAYGVTSPIGASVHALDGGVNSSDSSVYYFFIYQSNRLYEKGNN